MFPIWKWILLIYSLFAFSKEEIIQPEIAAKLTIIKIMDIINWYWWMIAGLIVWCVVTVISYEKRLKLADKHLEGRINQLTDRYQDKYAGKIDKLRNQKEILRKADIENVAKLNEMVSAIPDMKAIKNETDIERMKNVIYNLYEIINNGKNEDRPQTN